MKRNKKGVFPFLIGKVLTKIALDKDGMIDKFPFLIGKVLTLAGFNTPEPILSVITSIISFPFLIGKVLTRKRMI